MIPFARGCQYAVWWSRVFSGERPRWAISYFDIAELAAAVAVPPRSAFLLAGRASGEVPQAYVVRFDFGVASF